MPPPLLLRYFASSLLGSVFGLRTSDFLRVSDLGFRISGTRADGITNANRAGANNLGQDTLAAIQHEGAQALADGIHLGAGVARGVKEQHGIADLHFAAQERNEVDAR